jgi:hypothetical protein
MSNNIGIGFSPSTGGGGLGDLFRFIRGIGTDVPIIVKGKASGISLGGGIKGRMPQTDYTNYHDNDFAQTRFTLREAWNTTKYSGQNGTENTRIITPFRAVNNAGDVLSRKNYSCGGNCQTFQSRPNLKGLRQRFGAIQNICDETLIPPSACNVKWVYDGSDYTTYLRQRAQNKNYNDRSFGGNDYSTSQSAIRAIKRY